MILGECLGKPEGYSVLTVGYVPHAQPGDVAGAQLAIDSQVGKSQVPSFLREPESDANSPDISDSKRDFLADELSLIPRLMANGGCFHGLSSSVRKYKHGPRGNGAIRPGADAHRLERLIHTRP